MIRSFFNITLRIHWRNNVASAINILSLSIGITAFILILLNVHHETSYDKFNENYDRIYRLERDQCATFSPSSSDYQRESFDEFGNIAQIALGAKLTFRFFNISSNFPGITTVKRTNKILVDSQFAFIHQKNCRNSKKYLEKSKKI